VRARMLVRDVCEIACGPEHLLAPLHPHDSASCIRVTRLASSAKLVMTRPRRDAPVPVQRMYG
jgi:hypothetical protein